MDLPGSKTRSVGQIVEKTCEHSRDHSFWPNLYQTRSSSSMDVPGLKTRSVGQMIEKPYEHSRGHSFGTIFIKLDQNPIWIMGG